MAPEQAAGAPPDPRQDLYAAGVVAAQLLGGRLPPPVPDGPLRPLIEALTEPDPALRPPTAAAALERLRRIDVPRTGRGPRCRTGSGRPGARRGGDRWANVACIVGVAASVIVAAARRRATG